MDCKQAERWYDDLADGRLAEAEAVELRRHLAECTDCRVAQQRAARLQQLLHLKRHEQPPPGYFNNFLAEFHRRLDADDQARASRWQWLHDAVAWRPMPAWRYALVTVGSVVLAAGLLWQIHASDLLRPTSARHQEPVVPVHTVAQRDITPAEAVFVPATPRYILDRIAVTPVGYEASSVRF